MRRHAVFGALLLFCIAFSASARAGEQLAHAIFVKVNGKTITQDNVIQAVKYLIKREYNDVVPDDEEELEKIQKAALRDLVRTILIHDEAANNGVKTNRRRVEARGLAPEDITPTIRRMLVADEIFEELMMAAGTPVMEPRPSEIKKFYNENREEFRTNAFVIVRTIFIAEDGVRPQAFFKEQAERLMREIEAVPLAQRTEAFAKKAEEVSQDAFAKFGGLLTAGNPERWIPKDFTNLDPEGREMLPGAMVEAIRRLNRKGQVRLAISAEGMHLMYCEDLRGGRVLPWEEASRIIEYVLKERYKNQRMREWINRIYDRSDVRWHDGTPFEKELLTEILLPSERGGAPH